MTESKKEHIEIDQSLIDDLQNLHNINAIEEIASVLHLPVDDLDIVITHKGHIDEG